MSSSRIINSARNSIVGIIMHILTASVSFICRTVFIQKLGVEYLGISGLYTNILSVLALSDLGLYTVMVYSLYEPVAKNNYKLISSLINYYRKLYLFIAIAVALIGLACIPLLNVLVKDSTLSYDRLVLYFVLILSNSVCSYFSISKSTLIRANQNISIIQTVQSSTTICLHLVQIFTLYLFNSYVVYLTLPIFFTILSNVIISVIANKKYPYLKHNTADSSINNSIKKSITNNLKSTFLYKVGATIMNSTDNILISTLISTKMVGYYNNYCSIMLIVKSIFDILIRSVISSIGNYNATKTKQEKFSLFKTLIFIFYFLASFSGACFFAIFNDFITIWIGKEYILDEYFLTAFVINWTVTCISNPLWMTRESSGVFKSVRYIMFFAASINISLSIALSQIWGLAGIVLATAISQLVTLFWYEPHMLCKLVFETPVKLYWSYVLKLFIVLVSTLLFGWILHSISTTNIIYIIFKIIICGIFTTLIYFILFHKSNEMQQILNIFSRIFAKIKTQNS